MLLCKFSFRSLPHPTGIFDKHPFLICFFKFSISFIAAAGSTAWFSYAISFHVFKNISIFSAKTCGNGVCNVRISPASDGCTKKRLNAWHWATIWKRVPLGHILYNALHGMKWAGLALPEALDQKRPAVSFSMHSSYLYSRTSTNGHLRRKRTPNRGPGDLSPPTLHF